MKRIYLFSALAGMLSLAACQKEEATPVANLKTPAVLNPIDEKEFVFTKDNSSEEFPTLTWSAADYGFSASIRYSVLLGRENGETVEMLKTSDKEAKFTFKEVNSYMTKTKAYPTQTYSYRISVASSVHSSISDSSNNILFTGTLFDPAAPEYPFLYVAESQPEWDWQNAYMIGSPGKDENYEGYAYFKDSKKFTLLDGTDISTAYMPGSWNTSINGEGFYLIQYNKNQNIGSHLKTSWSISGSATGKGNDADIELTYDPVSRLWMAVTNLVPGEFKFRANKSWDSPNYGDNNADGETLDPNGQAIHIPEEGAYIITLNLAGAGRYTYQLEKTQASGEILYMPGSYQDWKPETAQTLFSSARDFTYSGYQYYTAGTQFKFTDGPSWDVSYGETTDNMPDWNNGKANGKLSAKDGKDINIQSNGYYRIDANTRKMAYSIQEIKWSIMGSASGDNWAADHDLKYDPATDLWTLKTTLVAGEFKFRANGSWDINLGDSGTAGVAKDNGGNISVNAGNHLITLDLRNNKEAKYSLVKQ